MPWAQAQRLLALGWWLRTNGEAIYGSRPWTRPTGTTGAGDDVRYTTVGDALYAMVQATPTSDVVELDVAPASGSEIHVLGHGTPLTWEATAGGCRVTLPGRPAEAPALTLRLRPAPEG